MVSSLALYTWFHLSKLNRFRTCAHGWPEQGFHWTKRKVMLLQSALFQPVHLLKCRIPMPNGFPYSQSWSLMGTSKKTLLVSKVLSRRFGESQDLHTFIESRTRTSSFTSESTAVFSESPITREILNFMKNIMLPKLWVTWSHQQSHDILDQPFISILHGSKLWNWSRKLVKKIEQGRLNGYKVQDDEYLMDPSSPGKFRELTFLTSFFLIFLQLQNLLPEDLISILPNLPCQRSKLDLLELTFDTTLLSKMPLIPCNTTLKLLLHIKIVFINLVSIILLVISEILIWQEHLKQPIGRFDQKQHRWPPLRAPTSAMPSSQSSSQPSPDQVSMPNFANPYLVSQSPEYLGGECGGSPLAAVAAPRGRVWRGALICSSSRLWYL